MRVGYLAPGVLQRWIWEWENDVQWFPLPTFFILVRNQYKSQALTSRLRLSSFWRNLPKLCPYVCVAFQNIGHFTVPAFLPASALASLSGPANCGFGSFHVQSWLAQDDADYKFKFSKQAKIWGYCLLTCCFAQIWKWIIAQTWKLRDKNCQERLPLSICRCTSGFVLNRSLILSSNIHPNPRIVQSWCRYWINVFFFTKSFAQLL